MWEKNFIFKSDMILRFTDEGEKDMYSEYIFDLSDKNVSDYVIYGKFTTSNMHIKGKWSVTFPLEKVR